MIDIDIVVIAVTGSSDFHLSLLSKCYVLKGGLIFRPDKRASQGSPH